MTEDLERYKAAGCQSLLPKPVMQSDLLNILGKFGAKTSLTAVELLEQQLAQDPQMQALKQQFSMQLPQLCSELQGYCDAGQWRELAFAAHSLKGSAGSMGYPELTTLAGELERCANNERAGCTELLVKIQSVVQRSADASARV
ncbi:Hpt domain-containing protein [Rheinheimera lutimaris]|uniref:Hpt domain-containing protein n=1 Tax=Rheinheimera lutimaris TaxID=2740584 RepID=UPI001E5561B7|nr:Hpt domain-containing protein [Rheinheimera lutimaris]